MASPLRKRFPRELRNNLGKWLGIFAILVIAISATTGFLAAAASIQSITERVHDDYIVEDIGFTTSFKASRSALHAVEKLGCTVYENFYRDLPLVLPSNREATTRVFANRTTYNLPSGYFEGSAPTASGQIALDRVFCANNELALGDIVKVNDASFELVGIMSLSDYTAQFQRNNEFVFNALSFTVCQVTQEDFDKLIDDAPVYHYALFMNNPNIALHERVDFEHDVADALSEHDVVLDDMVDADSNRAISYAAEDVVGDQLTWNVLLMLLIVIMAFVFVVLSGATIEEESAVIGTLLASGWRKSEIVRHYLALPALVGLTGCVVGNILGYTLFTNPMKNLYYNSYSLPPFVNTWNWRVFFITTVIPFILLMAVTFIGLVRKMHYTPLQFLRHEITKSRMRGGITLPESLPFVSRFRVRVFTRNFSQFVILFFGITFASFLLFFGFCMLPSIEHFASLSKAEMPAEHLYMLKTPLEIDVTPSERNAMAAAEKLALLEDKTDVSPLALIEMALKASTIDEDANIANTLANTKEDIAQAEKFAIYTLQLPRRFSNSSEDITVYGIEIGSRYWNDIDVSGDKIVAGVGVAAKCQLEVGEVAHFADKYTSDTFDLVTNNLCGNDATMNVYMSIDKFRNLFDEKPDYFNGYVSNAALNLNERYVASELTPDEMTKIVAQMQDSMSAVMNLLVSISVAIYFVLIYLLTKTVIDRAARSISSMKVFGYRDREINRLYVRAITATVLVSLVACLPLIRFGVDWLLKLALASYSGNITAYTPIHLLAQIVLIGIVTYAAIAFVHIRRVKHVPLGLAVKAQE